MTGRTLGAAMLCGALSVLLSRPAASQRTTAAITAADLKTRLYLISDDSMQGRATGSWGNFQTAEYIASEFRRLGLRPAGEGGTFFQTVPFYRLRAAPGSRLTAGSATLLLGQDYLVALQRAAPRPVEGRRAVFGGVLGDTASWISADSARDRLVVLAPGGGATDLRSMAQALQRATRFDQAAAVVLPVLQSLPPEPPPPSLPAG